MSFRKIVAGLGTLLATLFIIVGILLAAPAQVEADGQCHKINTTLTSQADLATFTTEGEIKSGFLKGTTRFVGEPAGTVGESSLSYTGTFEITTARGVLTTESVGVFETIPGGLGVQYDRVVAGTGIFAGAEGYLFFNFTANETGDVFDSMVTGEICLE